jgi:hypothetical protein
VQVTATMLKVGSIAISAALLALAPHAALAERPAVQRQQRDREMFVGVDTPVRLDSAHLRVLCIADGMNRSTQQGRCPVCSDPGVCAGAALHGGRLVALQLCFGRLRPMLPCWQRCGCARACTAAMLGVSASM